MKLSTPISLSSAANLLGCEFSGNPDLLITGINEIHRVQNGDLTFVDVEKYYNKALDSAATTILINKSVEPPQGKGLIISTNPFRDYNRLTEHFRPRNPMSLFGDPKMGKDVKIGKNVVFGENVELGDEVETQETEEDEEEKESSDVEESVENNDSTQNMSILLFGALALVLMLIRKK